jgi:hypothetical protein
MTSNNMNNKIIIVSSVLLVILLIYLSNDSVSESFSGFSGLNIMGSDELNNVAKLGKMAGSYPEPDHTVNMSILADIEKAMNFRKNHLRPKNWGYWPIFTAEKIPFTPRGVYGPIGSSSNFFFPPDSKELKNKKYEKEAYEGTRENFTVVTNYLFYTDNYDGLMSIPLCLIMGKDQISEQEKKNKTEILVKTYIEEGVSEEVALERAQKKVKKQSNQVGFCLPRIIFDHTTKKIDIKNKLPQAAIDTIKKNEWDHIATDPFYTFDSEKREFIDFNIQNGINQIAYTFKKKKIMKNKHEPSVIEVWINGIYLGKLTLKEDFDDRYDSIIHFGSLYGDIYWAEYIVNLILNGSDAEKKKFKDKYGIVEDSQIEQRFHDIYIKMMRNNEVAEIYTRKVRFYSKILNTLHLRHLYENREILMVGPRAFKQANFARTGDFGEFELNVDSQEELTVFNENGLILDKSISLNVYPNASASVDVSDNIVDVSDNIVDVDALSSMSISQAKDELIKSAEQLTTFSREYKLKIYNTGNWTGSPKKNVKQWTIYNFTINKKNQIVLKTIYDNNKRIILQDGIFYNICEVIDTDTAKIYINGELFVDIILLANARTTQFINNSSILLTGTPESGGIRIEYVGLKFFNQTLTPTEVNLLVYERLSGIEDLDVNESSGLKKLFKNVVGNFKRYKTKTKRELQAMLDAELDRIKESHRQEIADRDRLLSSSQKDLLAIAKREKRLREKRIQEFLRDNEKIEKKEYETQRKIKLKEKSIKKQKRRNKILVILLVTLILIGLSSIIYKEYGEDIKEYLSNLFGYNDKNYDYMKRSRMPKFPGLSKFY